MISVDQKEGVGWKLKRRRVQGVLWRIGKLENGVEKVYVRDLRN